MFHLRMGWVIHSWGEGGGGGPRGAFGDFAVFIHIEK